LKPAAVSLACVWFSGIAHARNLSIHTADSAAMTDDMCRVIVPKRPTYDLERNAAGARLRIVAAACNCAIG